MRIQSPIAIVAHESTGTLLPSYVRDDVSTPAYTTVDFALNAARAQSRGVDRGALAVLRVADGYGVYPVFAGTADSSPQLAFEGFSVLPTLMQPMESLVAIVDGMSMLRSA